MSLKTAWNNQFTLSLFWAVHIESGVLCPRHHSQSGWLLQKKSDHIASALIIVVIITWPEKFDFVLVPEHDVTGILT